MKGSRQWEWITLILGAIILVIGIIKIYYCPAMIGAPVDSLGMCKNPLLLLGAPYVYLFAFFIYLMGFLNLPYFAALFYILVVLSSIVFLSIMFFLGPFLRIIIPKTISFFKKDEDKEDKSEF